LKIRIGSGIIPIIILSIVLILFITFSPSNIARVIFGLPFILLFPGYMLTAAISPRKIGMSGVFRLTLSLGLSIVLVTLIGFALNYTSIGITLESVLYTTFTFILIMSVMGWFRLKKLATQERLDLGFTLSLPRLGSGIDRILYIFLIIAVLSAIGVIVYTIIRPKPGQYFTEFYILGSNGQATGYSQFLHVGETGNVIVGIVNHEKETVTYRIEVTINGIKNNEVKGITLTKGSKWENDVGFIPQTQGDNEKVEFSLFRNDATTRLFDPLRLWVNTSP
jgi:uncharacterized membrane protein